MKAYVVDFSKHGVRNVKSREDIPKLIKAESPAYAEILVNGKRYNVCVDLDSPASPRITGLSRKMDTVYLLNRIVVFGEDLNIEDIQKNVEEIVDPDFNKNYYAIVGIEDMKWAE